MSIHICEAVRVSPGEHGEGVERDCDGGAIGITEDGVRVCEVCAENFEREGFRVDYDDDSRATRELFKGML